MEIKLVNVARASLEELLEDYRDFLRTRGNILWEKDPRMTAGKNTVADFLLYVLPLLDFTLIVNPGAVPSINEGQISSQRIAMQPLVEQAAIIEYLNTETTKFDTLTAETQHAIDLLQERRTALISAAVTGQIDVRPVSERASA